MITRVHFYNFHEQIDYGAKVIAKTKGGKITADRCILAVNGFAPFMGHLKRKIFTIQAFENPVSWLFESCKLVDVHFQEKRVV